MTWERVDLVNPEFASKTPAPDICGLLYSGKRHMFSGPPESAKTLGVWIMALNAIRRGDVVAHIDFEMGPNATRELLEDLGFTLAEIASIYYVQPDGPPSDSDFEAMLHAKVRLAVIDAAAGAYDVAGLDDHKRKDAEAFARAWIRPLWGADVTTVVLDHVVKNPDNRGGFAIGSERKAGSVDVHLGFEVAKTLTRGGTGIVKVHRRRDRPGWLRQGVVTVLELVSDPETHAITWTWRTPERDESGEGFRPTVLMDRVLEYVAANPAASCADVERNVKGKSTDWKRKAIEILIAEGRLSETRGARNARLLTLIQSPNGDLASPRLTSPGEDDPTSPTSPTAYRRGEVAGEDAVEVTSPGEVERLAALLTEGNPQ